MSSKRCQKHTCIIFIYPSKGETDCYFTRNYEEYILNTSFYYMHFAKRGAYQCLASDVIEKDELKLSQWPGKKELYTLILQLSPELSDSENQPPRHGAPDAYLRLDCTEHNSLSKTDVDTTLCYA